MVTRRRNWSCVNSMSGVREGFIKSAERFCTIKSTDVRSDGSLAFSSIAIDTRIKSVILNAPMVSQPFHHHTVVDERLQRRKMQAPPTSSRRITESNVQTQPLRS